MASKKKAAATVSSEVPSVIVSEDGNKAVARTKASVAKKWNLTRAESLAETVHLAWFFVALGRDGEARELAEHVAERVSFTGDKALWAPAAQAIALAARLARLRGDDAPHTLLAGRLAEHPVVASSPAEAFAKALTEAGKDIRSAEIESAQKWALEGFARGCARAAYFREAAAAGAFGEAAVDAEALERTLEEGLAGLRAHLAR